MTTVIIGEEGRMVPVRAWRHSHAVRTHTRTWANDTAEEHEEHAPLLFRILTLKPTKQEHFWMLLPYKQWMKWHHSNKSTDGLLFSVQFHFFMGLMPSSKLPCPKPWDNQNNVWGYPVIIHKTINSTLQQHDSAWTNLIYPRHPRNFLVFLLS